MKFAGDIALGQYSDEELEDFSCPDFPEGRGSRDSSRPAGIRLGLLLSVIVHGALAAIAITTLFRESSVTPTLEPSILRVNFVRSNPPQPAVLDVQEEVAGIPPNALPQSEASPAETVASPPSGLTEQSQPDDTNRAMQDTLNIASENTSVVNAERETQDVEIISIPDTDSVRSAIIAVQRQEDSVYQAEDCTKLDEESLFSTCSPADSRDYSSLTSNPVYDGYKPGPVSDRRMRAVTVIASQSDELVQGLSTGDVMPGLSAYVLEELEQGIELRSNGGNRALNHMNTMLDKSDAGEMSRRLFDPWVVERLKELEDRRVK